MTSEPNADILEIDPNQFGKAVAANTAFGAIDSMLGGILTVAANSNPSPYTIPYQTADEPSGTKTALRFFKLSVTGALSGAWTTYMPSGKQKFFVVQNNTTGGFAITVKVSGQTGVTVPPGGEAFCFLNGADVEAILPTQVFSVPRTVTNTGAQVVNTYDSVIIWNPTTPAAVTFTLPSSPTTGETHGFKNLQTGGQLFTMTVQPASGTIDGAASITVAAGGYEEAYYTGTTWIVR